MAIKMVQIGVRIPQEDATFISQLNIEGANTPSDKLRTIIAQARKREQGSRDYKKCLSTIDELLMPIRNQVRELELHQEIHSEFVMRTLDWLSEVLAFCMASRDDLESSKNKESLEYFEKQLSSRIFRIMESVLQMGITTRGPCYQPNLISANVQHVLDIANVITQNRSTNI
ncbi:MAG: hypothetical protein ABW118_17045 [Candidatus Thiodiazotropha sp.]